MQNRESQSTQNLRSREKAVDPQLKQSEENVYIGAWGGKRPWGQRISLLKIQGFILLELLARELKSTITTKPLVRNFRQNVVTTVIIAQFIN